ncbi:MAG: DegT/DnrJ/EryC1/StrS family aminotransferase [Armatimonadota bacterium]
MKNLALLGGIKCITAKSASPGWPRYSPRAVATVAAMLYTGRGLGYSRLVEQVEARFADYHGVRYALAVGSGTGALHSALAGCGIEPGDEVITTPYSYGATTACILHQGGVPVFTDVLPDTGLLDPAGVEARVTDRTRAIVVVHLFGQPADMHGLQAVAAKHGLKLIEDVAQAHGARFHGKLVGGLSDAAGFSCMNTKLLAATEMGVLLTDDREAYDRALLLSQHTGRMRLPVTEHGGGLREEYVPYIDSLVYNYRVTGIDCALVLDQLPRLAGWNRARAANRDLLVQLVDDLDFIRFPRYPAGVEPVYYMATLDYDEEKAHGVSRDTFVAALAAEGVGATTYIRQPIPLLPRMQAEAQNVTAAPWLKTLRDAGARYSAEEIPVCMELAQKRALQLSFYRFTEPEPKLMRQYADAFHRVAEQLSALREWQHRQETVAAGSGQQAGGR